MINLESAEFMVSVTHILIHRQPTNYVGCFILKLQNNNLGVIMNWIKWKLKLLWQSTFGKPKYINFTDTWLCFYTRCFLAQKAKRNRV